MSVRSAIGVGFLLGNLVCVATQAAAAFLTTRLGERSLRRMP